MYSSSTTLRYCSPGNAENLNCPGLHYMTRANLLSGTVVCTNAAQDKQRKHGFTIQGAIAIFADKNKSVFSFFS